MQTSVNAEIRLHLKIKNNLKVNSLFCNYCHGRITSVLENSPCLRHLSVHHITAGCQE